MTALGLHDLGLFAATVFVLNATPGVDMVYTATRTLQQGIRAGLAAALGISAGCIVHTLAAAFGLAALLAASAAAFMVVKWAGAAYLLWLAWGLLREAAAPPAPAAGIEAPSGGRPRDLWGVFRQGLLTNALNPKVALFFLALLPQFIATDAPHKTLAFLALGAWFIVQSLVFLVAFVLLVAPLARWQPGPAARRALLGSSGGVLALLGVRLALAERPA